MFAIKGYPRGNCKRQSLLYRDIPVSVVNENIPVPVVKDIPVSLAKKYTRGYSNLCCKGVYQGVFQFLL